MGLVEQIKNLRPELQIHPLGYFEDLLRRKIDIVKRWSRDGVSSQVAKSPWRRLGKGARIIPQVRSSQLLPAAIVVPAAVVHPFVTPDVGLLLKPGFKLGRSGDHLSPFAETLDPTRPLNGSPVRNVPIPFTVQPPAIQFQSFLLEVEWNRIGGRERQNCVSHRRRKAPGRAAGFRKSSTVFASWRDSPPARVDLSSMDLE